MLPLIRTCLGECKFPHNCACAIRSSYESNSAAQINIYDPPPPNNQPSRIVGLEEEHQLKVLNPAGNEIAFIKTDKCSIDGARQKCDCLLLNAEKLFLVEIKTSNAGSRGSKRREAVLQLGATIRQLQECGFDFSQVQSKGVICFKHTSDRPTQASLNSQRAIFLENFGVSLEEGNIISF